jgi:hypothetical protein
MKEELHSQEGASLIEMSLSIMVVLSLMLAIIDLSRIAYTKTVIRNTLTETIKKSQGDLNLKANVWSLPSSSIESAKFYNSRNTLLSDGSSELEAKVFRGVRLIDVKHFDRNIDGETEHVSKIAYLPPGYSGQIRDWEVPVHNPSKCSPYHQGEGIDNTQDALFQSCSGDKIRDLDEGLTELEEKFPRVVAAFFEIDTMFFGKQSLNVQVAGFSPIESSFELEPTATPTSIVSNPGNLCPDPNNKVGRLCLLNNRPEVIGMYETAGLSRDTRGVINNPQLVEAFLAYHRTFALPNEGSISPDALIEITNERTCFNTNLGTTDGSLYYCSEEQCSFDCQRMLDGCFAKGTKILVKDGSSKAIETLLQTDLVLNPITGKTYSIKKRISGKEVLPLIEVANTKDKIHVTQKHPFITQRGLLKAEDLTTDDSILNAQGNFEAITTLRILPINKEQVVYNLVLDTNSNNPEDRILASGSILTPDFKIQQKLSKERQD